MDEISNLPYTELMKRCRAIETNVIKYPGVTINDLKLFLNVCEDNVKALRCSKHDLIRNKQSQAIKNNLIKILQNTV